MPLLDLLGLDQSHQAVYQHLLDHPRVTAAAIARGIGLPRSDVEAAVTQLEARGLVRRAPTRPAQFAPEPPSTALGALQLRHERELQFAGQEIDQLDARYRHSVTQKTTPMDLVDVIVGREAYALRVQQLAQSAREEVLALDRPPYAAQNWPVETALEPAALKRGVRWRSIYDLSGLDIPGRLAQVQAIVAAGEEARVLHDVPLKLMLTDRSVAILPLPIPDEGDVELAGAILVRAPTLLTALRVFFDLLWERATPLLFEAAESPLGNTDDIDTIDRQILSLLVAGQKDEAIARTLGLADRTVRRRIKQLQSRIGVQTRFQLAHHATRSDWV